MTVKSTPEMGKYEPFLYKFHGSLGDGRSGTSVAHELRHVVEKPNVSAPHLPSTVYIDLGSVVAKSASSAVRFNFPPSELKFVT